MPIIGNPETSFCSLFFFTNIEHSIYFPWSFTERCFCVVNAKVIILLIRSVLDMVSSSGLWLCLQKVFDLVSRRWKRLFGEWMDYCLHPIYPRSNSSNFSLQSDSSSSSSLYCLYLQMIVLWSNDRLMDQARPGLLVSAEDIESFIR